MTDSSIATRLHLHRLLVEAVLAPVALLCAGLLALVRGYVLVRRAAWRLHRRLVRPTPPAPRYAPVAVSHPSELGHPAG
jgi:hypothetical protein